MTKELEHLAIGVGLWGIAWGHEGLVQLSGSMFFGYAVSGALLVFRQYRKHKKLDKEFARRLKESEEEFRKAVRNFEERMMNDDD
jgi:hypothetical protein